MPPPSGPLVWPSNVPQPTEAQRKVTVTVTDTAITFDPPQTYALMPIDVTVKNTGAKEVSVKLKGQGFEHVFKAAPGGSDTFKPIFQVGEYTFTVVGGAGAKATLKAAIR